MKRMLFSLVMLIGAQEIYAQQWPSFGTNLQQGASRASGWLWSAWNSVPPAQRQWAATAIGTMLFGGILLKYVLSKKQNKKVLTVEEKIEALDQLKKNVKLGVSNFLAEAFISGEKAEVKSFSDPNDFFQAYCIMHFAGAAGRPIKLFYLDLKVGDTDHGFNAQKEWLEWTNNNPNPKSTSIYTKRFILDMKNSNNLVHEDKMDSSSDYYVIKRNHALEGLTVRDDEKKKQFTTDMEGYIEQFFDMCKNDLVYGRYYLGK